MDERQRSEVIAAKPRGLIDHVIRRQRANMHQAFIASVVPRSGEAIIDIGASAEAALLSSNHLEQQQISGVDVTACGLGMTSAEWCDAYPDVPYVHGDAMNLPFPDGAFDIAYSHAVIEHVGSRSQQAQMVKEAMRVARRAVWITTPNRWHPIEFHSVTPFVHWLPVRARKRVWDALGKGFFADINVLNLLDHDDLENLVDLQVDRAHWSMRLLNSRFLGFTGNLLLHLERIPVR